ncbi:MAG: hypothetical protein M0R28_20765 [Pigmentiphaga sp.]|nr:hypothetical protein [Pigmentiphaga sp.]
MNRQPESQEHSGTTGPGGAESDGGLQLSRGWRWALYGVVAVVLGLAFAGYQSANMVLLWETFLTLCGVR